MLKCGRKRITPLIAILFIAYVTCLITLIFSITQLMPTSASEISQIQITKDKETLSIVGQNLAPDYSAILTPNLQRSKTIVSSQFTWGDISSLNIHENCLWITNGVNGLLSYEISDPQKPTLAASLPMDCRSWSLTIDGNDALLAGGAGGLFGIDISNPEAPKQTFAKYKKEVILGSLIKDKVAIILTSESGPIILDIHDIRSPVEISRMALEGRILSILHHNNTAYLVGLKEKKGILHVLDISDPYHPIKQNTIQLPHTGYQSAMLGNKLFIAMNNHGLYTIDTTTLNDRDISTHLTQTPACGLAVLNDNIFIASGSLHVQQYQLKNNTLALIKTFLTKGQCQDIALYQHYLIAGSGKKGFEIFNTTQNDIINPPSLVTNGGFTHILYQDGMLALHDIHNITLYRTNPNNTFTQFDTIYFKENISSSTIDRRFLYVSLDNNEIHKIELHPLARKRTNRKIKWIGRAVNINTRDSDLFMSHYKKGLFVLKENTILSTDYVTTPLIPIAHRNIAIDGNYIYMLMIPNGLRIYHLDTNEHPTLVSELHYPTVLTESSAPYDITINNGYVYVANGYHGLLSINVKDPKHPIVSDSLNLSGCSKKVVIYGNHAYISRSHDDCTVVDISDPKKMVILCDLPTTRAVAFGKGKLLQLNEMGVYRTALPQPLTIKKQDNSLIEFNLPIMEKEGFYDLQLASRQELTKYSDLLHFSAKSGWQMTREINLTTSE